MMKFYCPKCTYVHNHWQYAGVVQANDHRGRRGDFLYTCLRCQQTNPTPRIKRPETLRVQP